MPPLYVVQEMKIILIAAIGMASLSCKPSYSYEGQQRGGDPYRIEWITKDGEVATCFVIDSSSSPHTASTEGIIVNSLRFTPEGRTLVISDAAGTVKESPRIQDYIYFCSSGGYKKIKRSKDISDLMREDYRVMDHKLIDHLVSKKLIP
jgi:hypothetical protein